MQDQQAGCFAVADVKMIDGTGVAIFCRKPKRRHGKWHGQDGIRWEGYFDPPFFTEMEGNLSWSSYRMARLTPGWSMTTEELKAHRVSKLDPPDPSV